VALERALLNKALIDLGAKLVRNPFNAWITISFSRKIATYN
jgi:hypothetical protein